MPKTCKRLLSGAEFCCSKVSNGSTNETARAVEGSGQRVRFMGSPPRGSVCWRMRQSILPSSCSRLHASRDPASAVRQASRTRGLMHLWRGRKRPKEACHSTHNSTFFWADPPGYKRRGRVLQRVTLIPSTFAAHGRIKRRRFCPRIPVNALNRLQSFSTQTLASARYGESVGWLQSPTCDV